MKPDRRKMSARRAVELGTVLHASLLFAVGLFFSACQPEPVPVGETDCSGIYTLVSVDGAEVPAEVSHGEVRVRVHSGTFTINPDGTCGSKVVFGPPSGEEKTREVNATYTRKGSELIMRWENAGMTKGTVEGDRFTMDNEGMIFAYQKDPAPAAPGEQNGVDVDVPPIQ